ncbi:Hepatic leukemia factor [Trichinella nativa]|uniref:Hepatic leukemia factor n=1 Tax=Trichinella nativa TaxID=6335 RepID=A0A0V1L211_9BILA|nr:Hepatic leukemia factor [Trichinella nativa]
MDGKGLFYRERGRSREVGSHYQYQAPSPVLGKQAGPDRTEREIAAAAAAAAVAIAADRLSSMAEVPAADGETSAANDAAGVVGEKLEENHKSDTSGQIGEEEKPNDKLSKRNFLQSDSTNTSNGTSAKVTPAIAIGLTSISAPLHHHRQSNSTSSSSSTNTNTNNNTNMTSCQDNLISPHPHDSGIAADLDDTTQSVTPLNLSTKKRRRVDNLDGLRAAFANRSQQIMENNGKINYANNNHLPLARLQQQQQQLLLNGSKSAFEAVSTAALFSQDVNMPSALSAALTSTTASPLLLNRLLPFTFLPNGGSFTNNGNNGQTLPSQSAATLHPPFNIHDLLLGGYFTAMPTTTTTGKQQRPFKAYNPMDPMSALQYKYEIVAEFEFVFSSLINGLNFTNVNGNGAALLGNMPVGSVSTAQFLSEHVLHPYRQYLQQHQQQLRTLLGVGTGRGASGASQAPVVRTKSTEVTSTPTPTPEVNGRCASRASSLPLQLAGEIASLLNADNRGNSHSTSGAPLLPPSPPEVTSTSHPHTDLNLPHASDQQQQQQDNKSQQQQKASKQQKQQKRDNTSNNKAGRPDQQQQQPGGRPASSSSTGSSNNGRSSSSVAANDSTSPAISDEQQQQQQQQQQLQQQQQGDSNNAAATVGTIPTSRTVQMNGNCNNNNNNTNTNSSGVGPKRKGRLQTEPLKDEAYWERRRKNNEAAKRSRDARRAKEDEIAVRAALLEQENMRLRIEVAALKAETEKLREMLLTG